MADYHTFTSSRTTLPDTRALIDSLRATVDPSAGPRPPEGNTITVKIDNPWTPAKIAAAQTAIDTAPAMTPQREAQQTIDHWPIEMRAFASLLVKRLNLLGARVTPPVPAVTLQQVLQAIRDEADTLS